MIGAQAEQQDESVAQRAVERRMLDVEAKLDARPCIGQGGLHALQRNDLVHECRLLAIRHRLTQAPRHTK